MNLHNKNTIRDLNHPLMTIKRFGTRHPPPTYTHTSADKHWRTYTRFFMQVNHFFCLRLNFLNMSGIWLRFSFFFLPEQSTDCAKLCGLRVVVGLVPSGIQNIISWVLRGSKVFFSWVFRGFFFL